MFKSEGKGRALYQKLEYILPTFLVESNLVEGGHSREGGAAKLNLGWEVTHLDLKEQSFYEIDGRVNIVYLFVSWNMYSP